MKSFMITLILLGAAAVVMGVPLKFEEFHEDEGCIDDYPELCSSYAAVEGYCDDYKNYTEKHCRKACGFCQPQVPSGPGVGCRDEIKGCEEHAANSGYCDYTNKFMQKYCKKTCGFCEPSPVGPAQQEKFFWITTRWGKCDENGVQRRGVKCFHELKGEQYQVDLKYCREYLTSEVEPKDERLCRLNEA